MKNHLKYTHYRTCIPINHYHHLSSPSFAWSFWSIWACLRKLFWAWPLVMLSERARETHWHIPRRGTIQIASSPYPITSHHVHTIPHPIISHLCCVLACMLGLDILWRTLAWLQKNTNNFIPRPRCIKPGAYKPYLQNAPPTNPLGISLTKKSFCEGRTL